MVRPGPVQRNYLLAFLLLLLVPIALLLSVRPVEAGGSYTVLVNPTLPPNTSTVFMVTSNNISFSSARFGAGGGLLGPVIVDGTGGASSTTLTSSLNPSMVGPPLTFTATVTCPGFTPTGSVTFTIDGVQGAPVPLGPGGIAALTIFLAVGSHPLLATYSGDLTCAGSVSPTLTQVVTRVTTTTALTSSLNPSTFGQAVTFTATMSCPGFGPAGTMTFTIDGVPGTGLPLPGGIATFTTGSLTVGSHLVTASYSGLGNCAPSMSSLLTQVVQAASSTALTSSSNPSFLLEAVTFTAAVTCPGFTPTGTVTFTIDGVPGTAVPLSGGSATFTTDILGPGSHAVTASYSGDGNCAPSTSSVLTQVVIPRVATTTTLMSSLNPSVVGQAVTFTATMDCPGFAPAGTMTFTIDGVTGPGQPLPGGMATFTTSILSVGSHLLTADYSGLGLCAPSTSNLLTQVVNAAPSSVTLTSSQNPSLVFLDVTFTAIVTCSGVTPTGTVTFTIDGVPGTPVPLGVGGRATFDTSTLTVGSHPVTATYNGDSSCAPSTASLPTQVVTAAPSSVTLTSSLNPSLFGQAVTFTATVTCAGGDLTPTGTVTFTIDGVPGTPVPLGVGGRATFTTSSLTVGSHPVTVDYSGDTSCAPSTSSLPTQVVNAAGSTVTLTSSLNPSLFGQAVTFTATVTCDTTTPTGTVTFTIDGVPGSPVALSGGGATFTTSTLTVGSHSVTAHYNGDTNCVPSTSNLVTQVVNAATSGVTLTSSLNPSLFGQAVTFTATVTCNTTTPTGTVTFTIDGTPGSPVALSGGVATFTTSTLAVGSHPVTAHYNGDTNCAAATSNLVTQVVNAATSGVTLTSSLNPSLFGQAVTFTATVTCPGSTPTGTVTFTIDGVPGTPVPLVNGVATFTTSTLAVGSHSVTAHYNGDTNCAAATSSVLTQVVNAAGSGVTLTSSANPSTQGQAVTFTAAVTCPGSTPTGTVTFTIDGVPGTPVPLVNGVATFTTSTLAVGSHSVTAHYNGDANCAASTSSILSQVVQATPVPPPGPGGSLTFTGTKTCAQPFTGGGANNSGVPLVTDCTVTLTAAAPAAGTTFAGAAVSFTDILLDPHACIVPRSQVPVTGGAPGTTSVSPCTAGQTSVSTGPVTVPTTTATNPACPAGLTITGTTTLSLSCALPPIVVIGPTSLCEEIDLTLTGVTVGTTLNTFTGKIQVCPPNPVIPPTQTNPMTGVTVTKTCTPSFAGATAGATKVTDCTLVFTTASGSQFNNGTTLEFDTITGGNAVFSTASIGGGGVTTNGCENGVGGGGILSSNNTVFTCVVGPIIVSGSTTLCETVQILDPLGNSSAKLNVCPTGTTPTPTSGLNFTVVKNCTAFVPPTITAGGTSVTDCTLVFTSAAGTAFPPDVYVADDTITSAGASFSSSSTALNGIELVGTASGGFCQSGVSTGTVSGFTLTCLLPPIVVTTLPNQICETVELGSATLGFSSKVNVCGFAAPTPTPTPVVSALQPTDENKTCTNTASNALLNQTLGGTSQSLGVSGPGKTFTLPLFSGASTCAIQLYRGGTACNTTTNTCADGNVQVTLSTGGGAAISCAASGLPAGQVLPTVSGGGGTCQQQVQNTQINVPCGVTAGTADASTKVSNTCTGVLFDIQSLLGACVNSPTSGFCSGFNGSNFAGTTATVTVIFFATPANGGSVGGIQLGTNTFTFSAPAIGLLLVSASPQLIPSNGTVASVVTATFACGTGASSINGFPLSNTGVAVPATFTTGSTTIVNQPIIGTGQNAVCGAGLAGTFSFTSPGPVLFDNGRSSETVNCGVGGNVSPFGVGAAPFGTPFGFAGNGINSTYPLVFTCTGAAVLAIGAGVAGDAPINVVYQGPLGLSAVGSTLITVSPSGIPRIAVSCNPSTIAAGSTGSICTATVTDINGTPLSGMTGATVTWTVSDPSNASILPCLVNVPGNLNITTYPNIAPQISPNTPCQVPTGQIPGQNTTFLNGQAAALLVASPTAHPETVTVTAALGVLIPPSFSCLVSPYLPGGYGTVTSPYTAPSGVGLPGVSGCGFGNPVGFTGLSTALSPTTNGLGIGGVILPNTTSASTTVNIGGPAGILIAGATPTQPYALLRGCNQVITTTTAGTPIANIAALVSPASAVVSIWRFSNNTKQFQAGFFSDPNAPTDFNITGGINAAPSNTTTGTQAGPGTAGNQVTETYFICVNQASTIVSG